jgi:hypothetical protein
MAAGMTGLPAAGWLASRIVEKCDLILEEVLVERREGPGVAANRVSVWRHLHGLDLRNKKDLRAIERKRPEVALARRGLDRPAPALHAQHADWNRVH